MRTFRMVVLLVILGIISSTALAWSVALEVVTEGSCRMEPGASAELVKTIALFNAKMKAVELAGRYLSHDFLVEIYELDKDEIYSLATREIQWSNIKRVNEQDFGLSIFK